MRLILLTLLLAVTSASAQTLGRPPADAPSVSFDALLAVGDDIPTTTVELPDNDDSDGIGVTSAAFALSGRVPVGRRWTVVAELPLAYLRYSVPDSREGYQVSDMAVGNPYVGAEIRLRPDVTAEGGLRLPLAQEPTFDPRVNTIGADGAVGGVTANVEQFEAYLSDVASLSVAVRYTPQVTPALGLRLRLAPTLITDTNSGRNSRTDLAVGYSLHADARRGPLLASVGATGRQFVSGDDFFDGYGVFSVDLAATLAASVDVGGVRPGVVVRIPITGDISNTDATVGLSLDVPIR